MHLSHKNRLYVLADEANLIYYIENDVVKKQALAAFDHTLNTPFLNHNPIGWKEEEISWITGGDFMLNRSFNLGLEFVYDAAQIIRYRLYYGNGYEEEMYLHILKWNREDDVYYLEYKGKLDFKTIEDTVNGSIKVNSIEGGLLSYFNANKSTVYEIACDESNTAVKMVLLDGMNLSETLNYEILDANYLIAHNGDGTVPHYILPMIFMSNEGDNEGVLYGNPSMEIIPNNAYYPGSSNYTLYNFGLNSIAIKETGNIKFYYVISDGTSFISETNFLTIDFETGVNSIPLSIDITLLGGQKVFFYFTAHFDNPDALGATISFANSFLKYSFISRKAQSQAFCLTLYDYYKQLVLKLTDGKFTGESLYLQGRTDLVVTCGDALRNTDRAVVPNYVIASSLDDFFQSVPGDKGVGSCAGLQVRGNVLYLELLSDLYNENTTIYDLGEVSNLKFKIAQSEICNTIQNGYPDQDYDTNGGKYEVNSEQSWQMPVLANNQVFDIRSKWRADARGIEQIRNKYTHLDTTDNSGDKQAFIINVNAQPVTQSFAAGRNESIDLSGLQFLTYNYNTAAFGAEMSLDPDNYTARFTGNFNKADVNFFVVIDNGSHNFQVLLYKNGVIIAIVNSSATNGIDPISINIAGETLSTNDTFKVQLVPLDAGFEDYTALSASLYFGFLLEPYTLYRPAYTAISGVLDNTVFNVELRPRNQLLWHGNELRGKLLQQQTKNITLNSAAKNTALSTTIGGVTETENDPIPVSSLADPLYLPYDASFTTQVPYTFTDLLAMSTAGYFTWTYEGYRFYGLPWGSMVSKPATNQSQEWQLRLSPRNMFADLFGVNYNEIISLSTNSNNMVASSIYSPLHWIKYDFTPQSKYHHLDIHEDWSYKRFQNWVTRPFYAQKWQTNDIIKTPVLTYGLGALNMFVYDKNGNLY